MKLILLGPPGSGKGTHAVAISARYGIPQISTGDIIRAAVGAGTPLGLKVKGFIEKGELVPDEDVISLVRERLAQPDCAGGFILDGFPRTVAQAQALEDMGIGVDCALDLDLPDEVIVGRVTGRRVCPSCGASYHVFNNPSKDGKNCDRCSHALIQRADDTEQVVKNRLTVYAEKTAPLTGYYAGKGLLSKVDGSGSIAEVAQRIFDVLEALR